MTRNFSGKYRQVFISYALDDPEWPQERVELLAEEIRGMGVAVILDFWRIRERQRILSKGEWLKWMIEALESTDYVVHLMSNRYRRSWEKNEPDSIFVSMLRDMYGDRRSTMPPSLMLSRDESGYGIIPTDLMFNVQSYRWPSDRDALLTHLATVVIDPSAYALSRRSDDHLWSLEDLWRAPLGDFPPPWASAWGDDVYGLWADLTVNGVTQRMRWIEPSGPEGFWMGSTKKERAAIKHKDVREWANQSEHEPERVVIAQGFWLADTPCTQAFWQAVTGRNPSHFSKGRDAPERPVESVSWNDVDEQFVKRFAQRPAWGTGDRLCLPSEEEWEHAARAGTRSAYWWGDAWDETRGNVDVTGERRWDDKEGTTPVHRYAPNPWGLFDVHGNVWEWCSSPWRPRRDAPEARPDADARVVRGGSWFSHPGLARAASRRRRHRGDAGQSRGFRFALRSPAGPEAR